MLTFHFCLPIFKLVSFGLILFGILSNAQQFSSSSSSSSLCEQYLDANIFIGTGGPAYGDGSLNPGAQYPFGGMRLGPDTATSVVDLSFRHFGGYHYLDDHIRAFSHNHLVGAGVYDLGNFGIMPIRISKLESSKLSVSWKSEIDWWSTFNKTSEIAHPGYYSVYLDEPNVQVDLLAIGTNAALHRYTWINPSSSSDIMGEHNLGNGLVVDVCHAAKFEPNHGDTENRCVNATISFLDGNKFQAAVLYDGKLSGKTWHYLYGEIMSISGKLLSSQWKTCSSHDVGSACTTNTAIQSDSGILFSIGTFLSTDETSKNMSVIIRVGLSQISFDMAKQNLYDALVLDQQSVTTQQSSSNMDTDIFSTFQSRTETIWCNYFNRFTIIPLDNDVDMKPILYAAYYRTLTSLTDYTESGDLYLGFDQKIHNVKSERSSLYSPLTNSNVNAINLDSYQYRFFSDMSLWDTYRTLHPWLLLLDEDISIGIARSMGEITSQQNAFPRWVLGNHEGSCMIGESGSSFILDVISNGFQNEFDVNSIATNLLKQSTENVPTNGRSDLENYMKYGYVSSDSQSKAAPLTLTYAYDDYILSQILYAVNNSDPNANINANAALQRSLNYKNLWSSEQLIFCPRSTSTGLLNCPKDAVFGPESWNDFVEGNAAHYSWFVPHDIKGLVGLYPNIQTFDDTLQEFFMNHVKYHEMYGSALPNPYYWAGNEHSSLVPWLFNYGSDCTNTQYWTRNITHMHFSNTPHGLPGNDDYGSMSSWVLFASLGLFPQAGLNNFLIGSPRVESASIKLRKWNTNTTQKKQINDRRQVDDHDKGEENDTITYDWTLLSIITYDNSPENVYVSKLLVNGKEWTEGSFISRSTLTSGIKVTLEFYMQSEKKSGLCSSS